MLACLGSQCMRRLPCRNHQHRWWAETHWPGWSYSWRSVCQTVGGSTIVQMRQSSSIGCNGLSLWVPMPVLSRIWGKTKFWVDQETSTWTAAPFIKKDEWISCKATNGSAEWSWKPVLGGICAGEFDCHIDELICLDQVKCTWLDAFLCFQSKSVVLLTETIGHIGGWGHPLLFLFGGWRALAGL